MSQEFITDSALIAVFVELAAAPSAIRVHYLALVQETMINEFEWGERTSFAHLYLSAHFIARHPGVNIPGASAALASRSIEGIAVAYVNGVPDDDELALTSYGRAYRRLLDSQATLGVVGNA